MKHVGVIGGSRYFGRHVVLRLRDGADEDVIDTAYRSVRPELPWHEEAFRNRHYGEGKRKAEAEFARDPAFPFVPLRRRPVRTRPGRRRRLAAGRRLRADRRAEVLKR